MSYRQSIGTFGLFLTALGGILGSGWLFGPFYAAQIAGPAAIISWVIGAILSIMIGVVFAELASAFPLAGGMVRFTQMSHGRFLSFLTGWIIWLSSVSVAPIETMAVIQYVANFFPWLVKLRQHVVVLSPLGVGVAAILLLIMCLLNWQGAKFFGRISSVIVFLKLVAPLFTIICVSSVIFRQQNYTVFHDFLPYGWQAVVAALPLGGVIYSYIGYSPAIQLAQEAKNPQRAIPLAIIGSLIFSGIIYILLQWVFIGSVDGHLLSDGWRHLHFPGMSGPFASIAGALGFTGLVVLIYIDATTSPLGTGFIYTTSTARVNYALSEIGFFPGFFKKLTHHGVPIWGLVVNYIVSLLLFFPFPGWQSLVSFIISCFVISYATAPLSLIRLREILPDQHRPFRLPRAYLLSLITFYISTLLIFWTGWETVSRLLIAMFLGCGFFCYRAFQQPWATTWQQLRQSWWFIPYLLCLGGISYAGAFGGKKLIPFGVDFVIIAILSLVVFVFATKRSIKTE